MVPIMGSDRINPVHLVHPVQTPEPLFPSAAVRQDWLVGSFPPEVPVTSVELDGPPNAAMVPRFHSERCGRHVGEPDR
jgi:hypothetical protein